MLMSIIFWCVLGLVAGFVANEIVSGRGEGVFLDITLGIVGALLGGWIFHAIGAPGVTGFDIWSLFVAVFGVGSHAHETLQCIESALAGRRRAETERATLGDVLSLGYAVFYWSSL